MIRVVIIEPNETRENLRELLSLESDFDVLRVFSNGVMGVQYIKEVQPDIVLIAAQQHHMDAFDAVRDMVSATPKVGIIMMTHDTDHEQMRQAMLAGVRDYLVHPIAPEILYRAIRRVANPPPPPTTAKNPKQNVIVCYSPTGGVGTTTIAVNVAIGLLNAGKRVLLIDADVQYGVTAVHLNLKPRYFITNITGDPEANKLLLTEHISGLRVLVSAQCQEEAEPLLDDPSKIIQAVVQFSAEFDYVVVDTPTRLDDMTISLFEMASQIVLVTVPKLATVKNARQATDIFTQLQFTKKVKLVLMKTGETERWQLKEESVAKFLRHPIFVTVPYDVNLFDSSIAKGLPVLMIDKIGEKVACVALNELVQSLL